VTLRRRREPRQPPLPPSPSGRRCQELRCQPLVPVRRAASPPAPPLTVRRNRVALPPSPRSAVAPVNCRSARHRRRRQCHRRYYRRPPPIPRRYVSAEAAVAVKGPPTARLGRPMSCTAGPAVTPNAPPTLMRHLSCQCSPSMPWQPLPINSPSQAIDELVVLHRQLPPNVGGRHPLLVPGMSWVVENWSYSSKRGRGAGTAADAAARRGSSRHRNPGRATPASPDQQCKARSNPGLIKTSAHPETVTESVTNPRWSVIIVSRSRPTQSGIAVRRGRQSGPAPNAKTPPRTVLPNRSPTTTTRLPSATAMALRHADPPLGDGGRRGGRRVGAPHSS